MAQRIVTQELVDAVADRLATAGVEPTIVAVQAEIGVANYTTIKHMLAQWKSNRQLEQPKEVEGAAQASTKGDEFVRALWSMAVGLADQRVTQVQAESAQAIGAARAALAGAEGTVARLEAEAELRAGEHAAFQTEVQRLIDQLRSELAEARSAGEVAAAQLAELRQSLVDLTAERNAAQAASLEQARLEGELAALRQQVADQVALIAQLSRGG